nr:unnamed protein product [Callosobruchus chinensis]
MFSYDETNTAKDIRLIDFQLCRIGTPVFDLSYCFYSGASKALLSQLSYFLDVYHQSLSQSLEQGVEKILQIWILPAVIIWKLKLAPDEEAPDLTLPENEVIEKFGGDNFISEDYLVKISDLVEHLKENNFV